MMEGRTRMRGKEGGCRGQSSGHAAAEMTVGYRPSGLNAPMAATIECSGGPHHRVRSSSRCPDMTRASDYLASEDQRSVFLGSLVVLSPSIYLIIFVHVPAVEILQLSPFLRQVKVCMSCSVFAIVIICWYHCSRIGLAVLY